MNTELKIEQKIYIEALKNDVWDALVNPEKIKKYLFGTNAISDWKVGSEIAFEGEFEGTKYRDSGKIIDSRKDEKFQYTFWSSFSKMENTPENHSLITFQLSEFGEGTELLLSQEGFASLEAKKHAVSSWDMVLGSLKEILEKEG